ncbi:MAG: histidine phosphatase family protein [Aggregatilineales bacterium]
MALKRVMFIRPGETDWNLNGRWQGWVAIPLNELGRQQIKRLAGFIRNLGVDAMYSSDTKRAIESANIIGEQLQFTPIFDERWRERNIGHWQGMILPEVRDWYADEYQSMLDDINTYRIPGGGESRDDVRKRVQSAFKEIVKKWDKEKDPINVGILTHTTAIRVLMETLIPDLDLTEVPFGNSSVTTITRADNGSWKLTAANDTTHLEGLESRYMPEVESEK